VHGHQCARHAGKVAYRAMATNREQNDLGFGTVVAAQSRVRLVNRDGSFNVERDGKIRSILLSPYNVLLTIRWSQFLSILSIAYLLVNMCFAGLFLLAGPNAIGNASGLRMGTRFIEAFFLSVQTFGTIGFGEIYPATVGANWVVSLESFISLLGVALATGLIFSRFSRPVPRIRFSRVALVAPYREITGFMFRVVNMRPGEIVGLDATVAYARFEMVNGVRTRLFDELTLERSRVVFFSLTWTIVHPIDASSPLYGRTASDLLASDAEFLILLEGTHETFSQNVHSRSSYVAEEVEWGFKFANVFRPLAPDGIVRIDLKQFDLIEPVPLPPVPTPEAPAAAT
jgi:inward rectifier potassium channel